MRIHHAQQAEVQGREVTVQVVEGQQVVAEATVGRLVAEASGGALHLAVVAVEAVAEVGEAVVSAPSVRLRLKSQSLLTAR